MSLLSLVAPLRTTAFEVEPSDCGLQGDAVYRS